MRALHAPWICCVLLAGAVPLGCGSGESGETQRLETQSDEARNTCGDGICRRKERCDTCPQDCGFCAADAGFSAPDASAPDAAAPVPDAGTAPDAGFAEPDAGFAVDAGAAPVLDCRNPASWPAAWVSLEDEVLVLVNRARASGATCGTTNYPPAGPLVMDAALREAARCHSLDMAVQSYFSHTSLDGRSPWQRIAEAGYTGSARAENIAAGYSTAAAVTSGWLASPGHCANIMSAGSNELGVGYAYGASSTYRHYWTQAFGVR